jgi:hypothetical protein
MRPAPIREVSACHLFPALLFRLHALSRQTILSDRTPESVQAVPVAFSFLNQFDGPPHGVLHLREVLANHQKVFYHLIGRHSFTLSESRNFDALSYASSYPSPIR